MREGVVAGVPSGTGGGATRSRPIACQLCLARFIDQHLCQPVIVDAPRTGELKELAAVRLVPARDM
jgi:hypothetical protein